MPPSDPRVFFAAERTLLAWLRTGLTIIALGFVVSRFGLFLQLLTVQSNQASHHGEAQASTMVGALLALVGAATAAAGATQHRRFIQTLPPADIPASYAPSWAAALAASIALVGIGLAVYMLFTVP